MDFHPELIDAHRDHHNENQPEGNNGSIPQAWGKTPPNTGQKRESGAQLARSVPSPSHSVHMRKIFQNASASLHSIGRVLGAPSLPRANSPSWQKPDIHCTDTSKLSGSPSEDVHFAFTDQLPSPLLLHPVVSPNGTRWTTVPIADEPISSGFHSPSFPNRRITPGLSNSQYLNRSKPKRAPLPPYPTKSPQMSLDEAKLAQRFQDTSVSDVQSWLDGLYDEPSSNMHEYDDSPSISKEKKEETILGYDFPEYQLATGHHYTSPLGSDKENMSPSPSNRGARFPNQHPSLPCKSSDIALSIEASPSASAQARRSKFNPSTPVLVRKPHKSYTSPRSERRGQISPTLPWSHFMLPPRRKKNRSSSSSLPQRSPPVYGPTQPFEISDDEIHDYSEQHTLRTSYQERVEAPGLRDLSPHVTPFRKGKGPKRPRCPSYYDEDLLQDTQPEGKKKGSVQSHQG
ncbi:hypothetical protein ACJ73_01442 [Blastomyces percursus]|uniref:Uncharacterized protein n=1 Tax=Blastomyces percursus TaxID=1658174 RepID=A0A1J9R470_9EURO|nr:hypothetical protein ACJ73_01442 [Blastomyces percursus]